MIDMNDNFIVMAIKQFIFPLLCEKKSVSRKVKIAHRYLPRSVQTLVINYSGRRAIFEKSKAKLCEYLSYGGGSKKKSGLIRRA